MDDNEAFIFVSAYFKELFTNKNVGILDKYLHKDYWDDDIGNSDVNHIENSKVFLKNMFYINPSIDVEVKKVQILEKIITAYIEWFNYDKNEKQILMKGIVIFELKDLQIIKRHTYMYYEKR
jgi:hypothetical protein